MRRGQGTMTASEFEDLLNNIVDLVKFTKDKDVFKGFYITQLAKRLLLGKSASAEEEISMVRKLQEGDFVSKHYVANRANIVLFGRVRRGIHDRRWDDEGSHAIRGVSNRNSGSRTLTLTLLSILE